MWAPHGLSIAKHTVDLVGVILYLMATGNP